MKKSDRTARLAQSDIRAMTLACAKVKGINMSQGVCDTPVPPVVVQGAQQAMAQGHNIYARFDGIAELRQAIAGKLAAYNRITADPEINITVSAGATGSFQATCMALLDPGDEVILFEPFYAYHVQAILAVEGVPRYVTMRPPDWTMDVNGLEQAITSKTKAIVVNTPGNPSGKVFTRRELEQIAEMACRHDLLVITDEIYEYFVFDGREHVSMASLPGMADRTITIGGYSKTFSITGWRIGYSVAEASWAKAIGAMSDVLYVCAPTPLQYGVAAGIRELGTSFYKELALEHQQKRDRFCQALITDEIYEYFVFDGREHVSMASLPGMADRTITIGGYSKTFSITGWRIGYSVAEASWAKAIGAMSDVLYVCAPTPLQYGVAAGIRELGTSFYKELALEHQQKRDRFCQALAKAGLPPAVPQGAYYVLADVARLPGKTSRERALYLLDKTGVAGVPGEAFFDGTEGSRFMRFCMAKTDEDLERASQAIERFTS